MYDKMNEFRRLKILQTKITFNILIVRLVSTS